MGACAQAYVKLERGTAREPGKAGEDAAFLPGDRDRAAAAACGPRRDRLAIFRTAFLGQAAKAP